jgi:L-lactate utilization protein LutC
VRSGITDREELRGLCAAADVGITSADYALADTGSLVMIAGPHEARLVSLLPPAHIAVVPRDRILTGLDELLTVLPNPADVTSSMVLITGPSRTADIEQILVRGVHGPGQITVVVVG